MDCKKAQYYMMQYVDGTIDSKSLYDLEVHLENCKSCKSEFELYTQLIDTDEKINEDIDIGEDIMDVIRDNSLEEMLPRDFTIKKCLAFYLITFSLGSFFAFQVLKEPAKAFFIKSNAISAYNVINYIDLIFNLIYNLAMEFFHMFYNNLGSITIFIEIFIILIIVRFTYGKNNIRR